MPTPSTVLSHPQLAEIQRAIQAHKENGRPSFREIERQFGLSHGVPQRYASEHMNISVSRNAKNARRTAKRALSKVEIAPVSLESPADVLEELRYLYSENKHLYERAKASSDTRLMDKAISSGAALLDRFAKSFGMFADGGPTINIHASRASQLFDSMPEEQLVAFISRSAEPKVLPVTIDEVQHDDAA